MSFVGDLSRVGILSDGQNVKIDGSLQACGGLDGPIGRGVIYYLDPVNGSDNSLGRSPRTAFKTLDHAYSKMTANQNDVLKILAGSSGLTLSASQPWAKDYTHIIGVCAPVSVAQRARIFNLSTATFTYMLSVSASGCSFQNLYIFQGGSGATELNNVVVTGGRNFFNNVHFAGMGHATPAADAAANSLYLNGAEENKFVGCTFGVDTILRGAANAQVLIAGTAKRNYFEKCRFLSYSELTTPIMVKIAAAGDADRWHEFWDCLFYNFSANHAHTLAGCFSLPATNATFDVVLRGMNQIVGIDDWSAANRTNLWSAAPIATSAGTGVSVNPTTA